MKIMTPSAGKKGLLIGFGFAADWFKLTASFFPLVRVLRPFFNQSQSKRVSLLSRSNDETKVAYLLGSASLRNSIFTYRQWSQERVFNDF